MRNDKAIRDDSAKRLSHVSTLQTDPRLPECVPLFQHLWEELGQLYGNTGPCEFKPADVEGEGSAFVVARLDGQAVGCGAFVPLEPGVAEVRRMFVKPRARRLGVALGVLRELERLAGEMGYVTVRLETGNRQPGAIRLYEVAGYKHIERYGRHTEDPLSICFEKHLG